MSEEVTRTQEYMMQQGGVSKATKTLNLSEAGVRQCRTGAGIRLWTWARTSHCFPTRGNVSSSSLPDRDTCERRTSSLAWTSSSEVEVRQGRRACHAFLVSVDLGMPCEWQAANKTSTLANKSGSAGASRFQQDWHGLKQVM